MRKIRFYYTLNTVQITKVQYTSYWHVILYYLKMLPLALLLTFNFAYQQNLLWQILSISTFVNHIYGMNIPQKTNYSDTGHFSNRDLAYLKNGLERLCHFYGVFVCRFVHEFHAQNTNKCLISPNECSKI